MLQYNIRATSHFPAWGVLEVHWNNVKKIVCGLCDTAHDYVTLNMIMWHCTRLCGTAHDYVTLHTVMWHCTWICGTAHDYVTLHTIMWHCTRLCDTAHDYVTLHMIMCTAHVYVALHMIMWHCTWLCGTAHDYVALHMITWHCTWLIKSWAPLNAHIMKYSCHSVQILEPKVCDITLAQLPLWCHRVTYLCKKRIWARTNTRAANLQNTSLTEARQLYRTTRLHPPLCPMKYAQLRSQIKDIL